MDDGGVLRTLKNASNLYNALWVTVDATPAKTDVLFAQQFQFVRDGLTYEVYFARLHYIIEGGQSCENGVVYGGLYSDMIVLPIVCQPA
jgi:hypothetical protein